MKTTVLKWTIGIFSVLGLLGIIYAFCRKQQIPDDELHRIFKKPFKDKVLNKITGIKFNDFSILTNFIIDAGDLLPDEKENTHLYPIRAKLNGIRYLYSDGTDVIPVTLVGKFDGGITISNPGQRVNNKFSPVYVNILNSMYNISVIYEIIFMI